MASEPERAAAPGILVLEPDGALRRLLDIGLTDEGFAVTVSEAVADAYELIAKHAPEAMVLTIAAEAELPVLPRIKERYGLPVLVITDVAGDAIRMSSFEQGADDVMVKPFGIDELAERLRFVLGAPAERVGGRITLGALGNRIEIDYRRRVLKRKGKPVVLSRSEWVLLRELAETPGEPRFDGELLVKAFGAEYRHDSVYLRMWMVRLQKKLGDDVRKPTLIRRYHGAAYVLALEAAAEETGELTVSGRDG